MIGLLTVVALVGSIGLAAYQAFKYKDKTAGALALLSTAVLLMNFGLVRNLNV